MRPATLLHAAARAGAVAAVTAGLGGLYAAGRTRPAPHEDVSCEPPPLPPGRTVHVSGRGELFVRETGARPGAPVILLLHGWMFPADVTWFTAFDALAEVGHVVALDHRGHGRGGRPPQPFRLADVADDAAALLRHLDAGPAVVVGYSMGGPVAQLLWQRHPDLVRGLVLCATAATFTETARERWQWRAMGLLQVLLRLLPRATWERAVLAQARGDLPVRITRMVHADTPPQVLALLPWMVGELARGSAEDVAEAGREMGRYDARGWLTGVDAPTRVLITAADQLVPLRRQRELAATIPTARAVELPLDHDAIVGAADRFVPVLCDAVRDVLAASSRQDGHGALSAGA